MKIFHSRFNLLTRKLGKDIFQKQLLTSIIKRTFCNITRLNVDKLTLEGKKSENTENIISNEEKKPFNKEDYILEYDADLDWEKEVLKSPIPVIVDCYAE